LGRVRLPNPEGFGAWTKELETIPEGGTQVCELRVVPAAQFCNFTRDAQEALYAAEWLVTPDANRMGYRFSGPSLKLAQPLELLSHGIVPGTLQVPSSGQPIVQLADANTCGGYPKIATIIEADLWRLAQTPVGAKIRFKEITRAAGIEALRDQVRQISEIRAFAALLAKRS
jgi:allophanate hydrolase subunit 2